MNNMNLFGRKCKAVWLFDIWWQQKREREKEKVSEQELRQIKNCKSESHAIDGIDNLRFSFPSYANQSRFFYEKMKLQTNPEKG